MGVLDRYRRTKVAKERAGEPLGFDDRPRPARGAARILELALHKPVERGGQQGLEVVFRVQAHELEGAKVVLEVSLHEQGKGPLKSRVPGLADALGNLSVFDLFIPERDEPVEVERRAFFPFAAIEVALAGPLKCFARVLALESQRGELAVEEVAFTLEAG